MLIEFEHLARHLARARIASNILPATGPVSSGGDGGRDFETFSTHASQGLPGDSFTTRSSGSRKLLFACSLQKKIEAKIRKDIRALADQSDFDEVIYFCEADVPIAKRLKLVKEAKAQGFGLQVFDGSAIAEWLAEPDIFWIAQEYLHLPSELAPMRESEGGYVECWQEWQERDPIPINRADFLVIKTALRKATFDASARIHLRFWLNKMAAFLSHPASRDLARNAMYEIAVANLRGRGDLNAVAHLVADYFGDVSQDTSIGELTDAVVLLTYCFGGLCHGQYSVDPAELFRRRRELADLLEESLAQPDIGPGRRSALLRIRGSLEFTPAQPGQLPNVARAFELWKQMLDCAVNAPLYPVEEFSDLLSQMARSVREVDELLAVASRADDLVEARAGRAVAGDKAIDRALSLLDRNELAAGIRELQKAKEKWFCGGQLTGTLRVLLLLAEQYRRFGLAYASKYYAMAAAYIAHYEDSDRVGNMLPCALLELLDAEEAAGNSLGYLQLFPAMVGAHVEHDTRPLDMEEHPRIQENMGRLATLLGVLKRGNPEARNNVDALAADWPSAIKQPIWQAADQPGRFCNEGSWKEVWSGLERSALDRPFGDLGSTRRVGWVALGIDFTCEFSNDYATTPGAEQLVAELQLAACAMAGADLGIVPCAITIKLTSDDAIDKLEFTVPDCGCEIRVRLPPANRGADAAADSIGLFAAILHCCSALHDDALFGIVDPSVLKTMFVGRPYAELYREFVPGELFAEDVRTRTSEFAPNCNFRSSAGERVRWFDGAGPTYNREEAQRDIFHRYKQTRVSLRYTLPCLVADPKVMTRLRMMHEQGVKDWEILSILSNIAINQRMGHEGEITLEQRQQRALEIMNTPEPPEGALDPALFSAEQLDLYAGLYRAAFLDGRQLRPPSCFSPAGLEQFLVARYRLREDDVEHDNLFGWSDDAHQPKPG